MYRLMITGSHGLLGQKLLAALKNQNDFSVIPTSRQSREFPLDITQKAAVQKCLAHYRPDVLIHTAALTLVDFCEQNKEICWETNVQGTENVSRACEKVGTHLIHLSSDFIFDGQKGAPYLENDEPRPVNYYGLSKWESEKIVRAGKAPWSIVRTSLVYGILPEMTRSNIALFVLNNLEKKKTIRVVEDQYRMPTFAEDLTWACLEIAKKKSEGIFHISGSEQVSVYEFALLAAEVFGLDASLIQPVPTSILKEPAKRPPRTGFVLDKAKKFLGYTPRLLREGLEIIKQQNKKPL